MRQMTEEEKQEKIMQVEAGLAFGGGKLSPEARAMLSDIHDGKLSHDEAVDKLLSKHRKNTEVNT